MLNTKSGKRLLSINIYNDTNTKLFLPFRVTKALFDREKLSVSFVLLFFLPLFSFNPLLAQNYSPSLSRKKVAQSDTVIPFKARWAVKTNAVDWLLMLPNATVEYDLSNSVYNRLTISLGAKWNWNTYQNTKPAVVYNIFDVRSELRYYYRTGLKNVTGSDTGKKTLLRKLKEDVFSKERIHPRYWRAYYVGGYISASDYTLKFGKQGIQGTSYGLGISAGFAIPLYGYKGNVIDLELGGSIGILYTEYDVFRHDAESNCYPRIPEKSKSWHVTPFPVVSDVRVAFVYRFSSVKNKYKLVDYQKQQAKEQKKRERKEERDSIHAVRLKENELKTALKDSANAAKLLRKELQRQAKNEKEKPVPPVNESAPLRQPEHQVIKNDETTEP